MSVKSYEAWSQRPVAVTRTEHTDPGQSPGLWETKQSCNRLTTVQLKRPVPLKFAPELLLVWISVSSNANQGTNQRVIFLTPPKDELQDKTRQTWLKGSHGDRRQEALHRPTGNASQQSSHHLEDLDSTGDTLIELNLLMGHGVLLERV